MNWLKRILARLWAALWSAPTPGPDPVPPDGGSSPPVPDPGNQPTPPDAGNGPGGFDLAKVTWVHGAGQDIASWPILCGLGAVRFALPYVVTTGATWPPEWPKRGKKNVQANHVVIAKINGQWWGGAWEALNVAAANASRPLEGLTKPQASEAYGPFCQVERHPFWEWKPVKGEWIGFMITSWIRSGVAQPVGRSAPVWVRWP